MRNKLKINIQNINNNRRTILKAASATLACSGVALLLHDNTQKKLNNVKSDSAIQPGSINTPDKHQVEELDLAVQDNLALSNAQNKIKNNPDKVKFFDNTFTDDIFLDKDKQPVLKQLLSRLSRVQKTVGYANFNLLSFDEMLIFAHRYPAIGKFSKAELAFIEQLFFYDANKYGFYGSKVITKLTAEINKKETVKIPGSGHYVFKGDALKKYNQLKKDVGPELILTSGVRSVVKQFQLFLAKLDMSHGNLSLASRSLAPPGHSYHGIGDFDVGKKGFGKLNFTAEFSHTDEYKKLIELKYIDLRYTKENQVGVRYEPWHIKVV